MIMKIQFINNAKDDWINSLLSDGSSDKTIYSASDSDNKWSISSNDNDIDIIRYKKFKSDSGDEFINEDNINISKKQRKRKIDPAT